MVAKMSSEGVRMRLRPQTAPGCFTAAKYAMRGRVTRSRGYEK